MSNRALCAAVLTVAIAAPAITLAQPTEPRRERHGLMGGGGLFGGNISCDGFDCGGFRSAGGLSGHLGWMFTPRLGVLVDLWAMTSSKNDVAITFVSSTINLRYWIAPVLWIQGGLGNGHAVISIGDFDARGDDVPVGQLAFGFEVVRARSWAIDVSAKVAQGSSTDDVGDEVATGRQVGFGVHFTAFGRR